LLAYSEEKNLQELSGLGHFLKGSSATLGFTKVKDQCEKIQHYGLKKDETGEHDEPDEAKCIRLIQESLTKAKTAYTTVSDKMSRFYSD
jgi:osomolarity two-component system, phosphorelay intermediate protein YPD1